MQPTHNSKPPKQKNKMKKGTKVFLILLIVFIVAFIADGIYCNNVIQTTNYEVSSSQVPQAFKGFKIAQISDLHNAELGKNNTSLIAELNAVSPDVIVITGDMVDSLKPNVDVAVNFAKEACKIAPCYYTAGNHEASLKNYSTLEIGLQNVGVHILNDSKAEIEISNEKIILIGIKDPQFKTSQNTTPNNNKVSADSLKNIAYSETDFTILLSHRPELTETYSTNNIDLVLSGHAHGGQIRIPFLGGIVAPGQGIFPKYDAGAFTLNDTTMIVSRGLGNSILPLRINNRAELVVVTLN